MSTPARPPDVGQGSCASGWSAAGSTHHRSTHEVVGKHLTWCFRRGQSQGCPYFLLGRRTPRKSSRDVSKVTLLRTFVVALHTHDDTKSLLCGPRGGEKTRKVNPNRERILAEGRILLIDAYTTMVLLANDKRYGP